MYCQWLLLVLVINSLSAYTQGEPLSDPFASQSSQTSFDMALLRRPMRQGTDCDSHQGHVRDLCQRCAAATKSSRAYPLCCDRPNTRNWCTEFLSYGLGA